MIEHSITKYSDIPPRYQQQLPALTQPQHQQNKFMQGTGYAGQRKEWTKAQCDDYIEELKLKGYTEGTWVTTKFGLVGQICGFRTIGQIGLSWYSSPLPDVIQIKRNPAANPTSYNENEIETLSEEPTANVGC